ncbi:MAG: primosomal protein N' [Prolixibacteraceae bacterium]|nr:primosomal protein N' [Prolixibacteraceae bacterium]
MKDFFADVILPLPLSGPFTYKIPEGLIEIIQVGVRVIVQFGQKKYYTAIVMSVHNDKPANTDIKTIDSVLDEKPLIYSVNLHFWDWVSEYYCCSPGEVMKAALPNALKLESSTKLKIANYPDINDLSGEESEIIGILKDSSKALKNVIKQGNSGIPFHIIKSLLEKKILTVEEKIDQKYKVKTEAFVLLNPDIKSKEILEQKLTAVKKAKKQEQLLSDFCELTKSFSPVQSEKINRKELLKKSGLSQAVLKGLVDKKILRIEYYEVSRLDETKNAQAELNFLNPYQERALSEIKSLFNQKKTVLLHGITSSGKTEIYSHLIEETIKKGKQVLYLVPEISLTAQLIERLKNIFGNKVGVYHSRLNDSQRVEIWEKVLNFNNSENTSHQIILGARSSVFLPFDHLGLIIVDEEHENSYKQFDPAPRYNARDLAVLMGIQNNANVLLGTATPSFETYFNVQSGKFGLVELFQRHGEMELPEILISDLQRAYKRKQMKSFLAPELYSKISESLERNEQVILFQNRRGYAPFVECMECGWIPKCERCDVSLTYHKYKKQLTCHYCGYYITLPDNCHDCGSHEIKTRGLGTEKIEDELKSLFPSARIARMDMDSTRSKNALGKIIKSLESRKTDILVGTQMVTKGLDFEHVNVVGILNADNLLNFPDFRAHERSYQLMSQVSGRAGRKHRKGTVVIQTSQPDHPVIKEVKNNLYIKSYARQLEERKMFHYPPFYRLVKIVVKHKNQDKITLISKQLTDVLRQYKQFSILGPEFPLISRISLWYLKEIWIKMKRDNQLSENKKVIFSSIEKVKHLPGNSGTTFNIDVDPM